MQTRLNSDHDIERSDDWYYARDDKMPRAAKQRAAKQHCEAPEPGIYENIPFDTYCRWPYKNNSQLRELERSPAHYRAAKTEPKLDSAAFAFGRFLHGNALDPSTLNQQFAIEPDLTHGIDSTRPKSTKLYKERVAAFRDSVGDKEIVTAEWFQDTQCMLQSMWQHERAREYLAHAGPAEVSIVWDEPTTGLRCKCRFDKWDRENCRVVDLKTSADVCEFQSSIGRFGYHRQAAFYVDAAKAVTGKDHAFCIVAMDKSQPFAVRAAPLSNDSIVAGRNQYQRLLGVLQECEASSSWPGPPDPATWDAPEWACREPLQLTLMGEIIHEYF